MHSVNLFRLVVKTLALVGTSTKEGSRPATMSDLILPISNVHVLDDTNDEEVVLDELHLEGPRAKTAKTAVDWWVSSIYSGLI